MNVSRKPLKIVLVSILVIFTSIITFFSNNLIVSVISNYAALSKTQFCGLPMYYFTGYLISSIVFFYRYFFKFHKTNPYWFKRRTYFLLAWSSLGIVSSIFVGTFVYGSFFKEYVFVCYPLVMLIVSIALLALAISMFLQMKRLVIETKAVKEKYNYHIFAMTVLLYFALNRFGQFLMFPIFAGRDFLYTLPYVIELTIPMASLVMRFVFGSCEIKNHRETKKMSSMFIMIGISLLCMTLTIILNKRHPAEMIAALSGYMQIERLTKMPVDFIVTQVLSIGMLIPTVILKGVELIKRKKVSK